ncbi:hypothetical protein FQN55_007250 [Onygenales sp. PD_40]|nr:hypothetical protein FQN55_007250 [Onygenales sp. PD_40]KAK2778555.1 hypothetical protein FQN53_001754 [Emmonsiellopsis sp. PD_33]KAK2791698.1 hypothetical protein FQN52_004614 [Onygenales sp. PD_12]
MPPTAPPLTPKRMPLHARSTSQTNEQSFPPTVRLIQDQDQEQEQEVDDETEIYSATPYPTKPEHILLPTSGKSPGSLFHAGYNVSDSTLDPTNSSSSSLRQGHSLSDIDHRRVSELSSTIHGTRSSSQTWDDDPNSSKTSIPRSVTPQNLDHERQEESEGDEGDDNSSSSDDLPLPSTIKAVPQEFSSTAGSSVRDSAYSEFALGDGSSPNVVPVGLTSSPNLVPLDASSPNLVPLGSSSPILAHQQTSDSELYSSNSVGTVRRYIHAGQRTSPLVTDNLSSGQPSSNPTPTHSIPSSPPSAVLRSFQSTSSFALPPSTSYRIHPSTSSASSRSSRSAADVQSTTTSGTPIQYPSIRAPSYSSRAESSIPSRLVSSTSVQSMTDRSSGRWNPHLSTVPSEWSAERLQSIPSASPRDDQTDESWPRHSEGRPRISSRASISVVDEFEGEEHGDNLTSLRAPPLRNKASGTLSHKSSLLSLNGLLRPPSSGSSILSVIPSWARVYYRSGGRDVQFSSLWMVESRPTTPQSYSPSLSAVSALSAAYHNDPRMISRAPVDISNPRLRPRELDYPPRPSAPLPPIDPRSQWVPDPEMEQVPPQTPMEHLPGAWSPHLHTDKRADPTRRSIWKAPSIDESAEGCCGRRNAQVYAFCLGFVFPLAWLIASFLPLPPQISQINQEATTSRPDLENAFQNRVVLVDELRHENARWWRNLNRCMTPVGVAIIVVVITLSVVFTRK